MLRLRRFLLVGGVFFGIALTLLTLMTNHHVQAATDSTINFQARLMNASGTVAADGDYNVEFKLYNASTSGTSSQGSCTGDAACLWTETRTSTNKVRVVNGYLTVNLGSVTAFSSTINWDQDLYLTMNIGGIGTASWDGEMSPRLHLTAVPYAFRAGQLAALNGSNAATLGFTAPTANRSILLPDESGTLCIQSSVNCGFALSTGSGSYIQNGTSLQSGANFNISGTGTAGTSLQAPLLDTASGVALNIGTTNATAINLKKSTTITGDINQSGGVISLVGNAASSVSTTTGALTLQSVNSSTAIVLTGTAGTPSITMNTGSSGSISIGTTTLSTVTVGSAATTLNLATSTAAHTVHIADGGTGTQTVTIGSTTGTSSSTTIQGGTGSSAIALNTATNGKISISAAGTGGITATLGSAGFSMKTTTDSTTALAVQASNNDYVFNVNTTNGVVSLGAIQASYSGFDGTFNTPLGNLTLGSSSGATSLLGNSSMTVKATSGSFTTTLGFTAPTANRSILLPNEGGTLCIQSSTNCGFAVGTAANYIQNGTTVQSANMYVQAASSGSVASVIRANAAGTGDILDLKNGAGTNVATFGSAGAVLLQNSTNSANAFQIQNATNASLFNVDTTTNGLITMGTALRLNVTATNADTFTTPLSSAVKTAINIPLYDPGAAGQILAFGLPSTANATARGISVFDARSAGVIQPAIAVFSPNENDVFGLSWNGLNTVASLETSSAAIALRPGGTNVKLWAGSTGVAIGSNVSSASYPLDVTGDVNTSTQYRIGGTVICTSTGCTPAAGSSNYIQNSATVQSANMYVQAASSGSVASVIRANAAGTGDILDLKNGAGTNVATFGSAGAFLLQNSTDSTNAFTINTSGGGTNQNVFRVDTVSERVAIGVVGGTPSGKLNIATGSVTALRVFQSGAFNQLELANATANTMTVDQYGGTIHKTSTNSTTAFQVQGTATGTALNVDTTNLRVGVGGNVSPQYALDATGEVNASVGLRVNGTSVCDTTGSTGCIAKSGSGFYIHNQTTQQTANLNMISAATNSITALFQGASGQTANILQINDGSSNALLTVGTSTVTLGYGGNTVTFGSGFEPTLAGNARHQKSIVLAPEYAGAVLDATNDATCSSANSGTMTSALDLTNRFNYYKWLSASGSAQCYDVVVQLQVPSDWAAWNGVPTVSTYSSNTTNGTMNLEIRDTAGTVETNNNFLSITPSTTTTWQTKNGGAFVGTYTAGSVMTLRIRMSSLSSAETRLGNITLNYYSKY